MRLRLFQLQLGSTWAELGNNERGHRNCYVNCLWQEFFWYFVCELPFIVASSSLTIDISGIPLGIGESDFFLLGDYPRSGRINVLQSTKIDKVGKIDVF